MFGRSSPMVDIIPEMALICADQGNRTTPSYVAFTEGERLIGDGESRHRSWS